MPVVNVRVTKDGLTTEQKALLVAEITGTLQRVLGKRPEHTHVIIEEIEPDNWGYAGMLTTEYRKQQNTGPRRTNRSGRRRPPQTGRQRL